MTSTAFGELPAFVSGLRSLHNNTPILNSWAGDGTYWVTKNPKVTNYYFVTYASVFGDDPSKDVRKMIAALKAAGATPGTGGFLGGADTIDGLSIAIKRAHGSLKGSVARGAAGEVPRRPGARREDQLLEEAAHGLRAPVPRDQDPEQQGQARGHGDGEGRPEALARAACPERRPPQERRGGPKKPFGPPPCRGPSRACRRCRT